METMSCLVRCLARRIAAVGLSCMFAAGALAQSPAQGPAPGPRAPGVILPVQRTPAAAPAGRPGDPIPLDRVIAVVNDEALTQWEVGEQRRIVLGQMRAANVTPPPADVLDRQVLDRLITERALMQFAKETGIRVDDTAVERTIQRVAQDNKLTPEQFRKALADEKIPYARYREDIRRELIVQRLRDRDVEGRINVSDAEVDNYLATVAAQAGGEIEYQLSHVLVVVPEQASPDVIGARRRRAEEAFAKVQAGDEFAQVAAGYSDAPDALSGGSLGWRVPARLPTVFAEVVRGLKQGEVSGVLRSPAGFHIVKLTDVRSRNAPTVVEQTNPRHILIRVNETVSEADAKARIDRVRERIEGGIKFEDMAKVNSEDSSSPKGGDLGWINPGDTVPDFERAMDALKVNELSQPVRTPFGWHLIQVQGRRQQDVTRERQRDQARAAIRARKSDEAFQEFVRQTRDRAYVEYKVDER